jgi:hypothetical protein
VFFIDGNLWIHNYQTMSLKFAHKDAGGVQVTFVVKGNIYISDNVFYSNDRTDGVAFIAMKDAKVADSGNVYFGDPSFGTPRADARVPVRREQLQRRQPQRDGSAKVEVYGNMTAGDQLTSAATSRPSSTARPWSSTRSSGSIRRGIMNGE